MDMSNSVRGGNHSVLIAAVFLLFLALGTFFRLYGLGDRNLWTDEAWVAVAATQPTPALAWQEGKSTPPLYLLTVWQMAQLAGKSEAVLRFTSVLFGLGALLLFWPLARALLPPGGALAAFALAGVSTRWVYFSKELKQYSADMFFAVLVFFLVERQLRRQGQGGWLLFTLLLALGLGFSHPLIFLLPAAGLVLWWQLPQARRAVFFSFVAVGLIFLSYYWFFFRGQVDPELLVYWQADFPPLTSARDFLVWLAAAWNRYVGYFFLYWSKPFGWLFLITGLVYFTRRSNSRVIWYFLVPILTTLAAALAHRYPFMGQAGGVRLMMFTAPMLFLVAGAGIMAVFAWLWPRQKLLGIALAAVVIMSLQPVQLWQENLRPQMNREEIVPLVREIESQYRPGDLIYVYYFAIDPFKFYHQGLREQVIWGQSCHDNCLPLPPEDLKQVDRLWLIFSHFETLEDVDRFIENLLGEGWTRHLARYETGAALFCYYQNR